jgi:hypothetical protein
VISGAFTGTGKELLSGVGFDQVDPDIVLGYEVSVNANSPPERLQTLLTETGCGFVLAYSQKFKEKLREGGYREGQSLPLETIGALPGRTYTLYQTPFETSKIVPDAPLRFENGRVIVSARGNETYRIRYWYYPGWKATQNGKRIPLRPASPWSKPVPAGTPAASDLNPGISRVQSEVESLPGIEFIPPSDGEVILEYSTLNFFLD